MRAFNNKIFLRLLAGASLAGAAALWLATGTAGYAASSNQTQGTAAAVALTISWGSAGGCTQSMGTADFGTVSAGASATSSSFRGCVTSNAKWNVSVAGTTPLTSTDNGSTIGVGQLVVQTLTPLPSGASTSCNDTNTTCTLDSSRSIISNAARTANQFDYRMVLSVPSTATGGTYTNGLVTFTAQN